MNNRGSALWEFLPVFCILVAMVGGILLAAYLLFARANVLYQSEQAIYCAAERNPESTCTRVMGQRIARSLPWGQLRVHSLRRIESGAAISAEWSLRDFRVRVDRRLDLSSSKRLPSFRW